MSTNMKYTQKKNQLLYSMQEGIDEPECSGHSIVSKIMTLLDGILGFWGVDEKIPLVLCKTVGGWG